MVSVKDIVSIDNLENNIGSLLSDYHTLVEESIQEIQKKMEEIETELSVSNAILSASLAKLLESQAKLASAIASENPLAITAATIEVEKAQRNYQKAEQRVELVKKAEYNINELNEYIRRQYLSFVDAFQNNHNALAARLRQARSALDQYLGEDYSNSGIYIKNKESEKYKYSLYKYKKGEITIEELNLKYKEMLLSKKDSFRQSNYTNEEGIKYSEYNLPIFNSKFDCYIPVENLGDSREKHFAITNAYLKEKIEKDPEFRKQFNDMQIQRILSGKTPSGYTWHHDGNPPLGKMQLVDSKVHDKIKHDGGYSLWVDRRE
ncbi:HNH endonuclease [Campylobacter devanensis]|uniref:HNH endonuclease n=1 Tax=Campylobacter devanensis TaxID=3161138 RepID=UPI000A33CF93|nr:HNH endonuclease [Campylobacter sp. P0098]